VTRAASGAPLNYTTVIEPIKSAGECTAILVAHGASAIGTTYLKGVPNGLTFVIETQWGPRRYSLPVNFSGTHKAMLKAWRDGKIRQGFTSEDQAQRVAWRVLKDWLQVQMALVEAGVAEFAQTMLPYTHVDDNGQTLWERYMQNEQRALEAGR
jgi:hypothetical protein